VPQTRDFVRLLITANWLHNNIFHTYYRYLYVFFRYNRRCVHVWESHDFVGIYYNTYCCVEFPSQLLKFETTWLYFIYIDILYNMCNVYEFQKNLPVNAPSMRMYIADFEGSIIYTVASPPRKSTSNLVYMIIE